MAVQENLHLMAGAPTRLPVARAQSNVESTFLDIPVINWRDFPSSPSEYSSRGKLLIEAWAALLRAYASSDSVTFEIFEQCHVDATATEESGHNAESRIAVCHWVDGAHSGKMEQCTYGPSVVIWPKSQLPSLYSHLNTGIFMSNQVVTERPNLDFIVASTYSDDSDRVSLHINISTVPEQFGQAISATLKYTISTIINDKRTKGNRILSDADHNRLRSFILTPLSTHQTCMHYLVKDSIAEHKASEAVCSWDGSLTYGELDAHSDVIARLLIEAGVRIGEYVPFAIEKSMWSVVAVLSILKAGAAFVPIDPTQPVARTEGMLADIGANIILTSQSFKPRFDALVKTTIVVSANTIDENKLRRSGTDAVWPEVNPEDVAFVLFTSGSTGKPKGIVMQHGAYSTHTVCHGRAMGYKRARVLQFAAHTFDVYVMDVFATLVFGGCVCIPSEDERRFNIVNVFNEFRIDLAILTPSFAHLLEPAALTNLRTLAVGGEALKKETVQKWTKDAQNVSLIQIYGPAEVGICILWEMSGHSPSPENIGYPLDNSLCLLIDPDDPDRLVPVGAIGELVVAGPTMLREYLNNPEKTKTSFLDDPVWAKSLNLPYRRFYRSGDLLRYDIEKMDGSFDFVGRKDSQVKYHGQRMELEDIEHHLSSIDSVTACMVSIPKEGELKGRLVAIVQLDSFDKAHVKYGEQMTLVINPEMSLGRMREHLSKRLPAYMIPNTLLVVKNVPFTPSLKLDRPQINLWVASLQSELVVDGALRKISCDVLDATEVSAQTISREYARLIGGSDPRHRAVFEGHDFCLQAGGIDSIQIISLSNFVQKGWKVKVPMSVMLSSWTTIRDVAALVDHKEMRTSSSQQNSNDSVPVEVDMLVKKLLTNIEKSRTPSKIQNVLLTGATGFLGAAILRHMLELDLHVIALVRDKSVASARQTLVDKAKMAGWWKHSFATRLEVWLGNLSHADLGLNDVQRQQIMGNCALSNAIHAIIHNGAKVHYGLDYATLKDTNVSSTLEILKLIAAASTAPQTFVYVSGGQQPVFGEEREIADVSVEQGYTRSKLISEVAVRKCAGLAEFADTQLSIVKPGYIIGAAADGTASLSDFLWRLVASCIEVGGYDADDADRWLFVADRGRIASSVVANALRESSQPTTQILDGIRFVELWQTLTNEFSFYLQPLPHAEWIERIRNVVSLKQDTHVMFPLMHMIEKGESIGSLAGPPQASPGVKDALRANISYLIKVGYLSVGSSYTTNGAITPDSQPDGNETMKLY